MRSKRFGAGLGLFMLLFLMAAEMANAHAWCVTRNKCRWWSKKFTANTHVGCWGFSLPLCYQHSGDCDYTANLSCGWRNCLWGGGDATASNGWGGCSLWTNRSGQGFAGEPTETQPRDDEQGGHDVFSRAEFDDATKSVTISLDRGEITALKDGMAGRLDVYILREEAPKEGETEKDPVPTPENTLWHGSVVLRGGAVAVNGFDPQAFKVTTDEKGISRVTFQNVTTVQRFHVTEEEFADLLVRVVADEE